MRYVLRCHGNNKAAPFFLFLPQQVRELEDAIPPTAGEMGRLQTVEEGAGDTVLGAEISSGTSNSDR